MVAFKRIGRLAGGWYLLSLAACGARTGELDGSEYYTTNSSLPSDGGAGAGAATSSAGSSGSSGPGTGTGGTTQAGSTGSGATSGTAGRAGAPTGGFGGAADAEQQACSALCMDPQLDPQPACPAVFGPFGSCFKDCEQALQVQSGACLKIGVEVALCISKVIESSGKDCNSGQAQAQVQCASSLNAYQSCAAGNATGPGTLPPSDCFGSGSVQGKQCVESLTCSTGPSYSVTCNALTPNQSACQCQIGNVTANLTLNEGTNFACTDAMAACGGPILPK